MMNELITGDEVEYEKAFRWVKAADRRELLIDRCYGDRWQATLSENHGGLKQSYQGKATTPVEALRRASHTARLTCKPAPGEDFVQEWLGEAPGRRLILSMEEDGVILASLHDGEKTFFVARAATKDEAAKGALKLALIAETPPP